MSFDSRIVILGLGSFLMTAGISDGQVVPASIHSEEVPPIPPELDRDISLYRYYDSISFQGWRAGKREVVFLSQSGGTNRAFGLADPDQPPVLLTVLNRPVALMLPHPSRDRFIVAQDDHGDEKYRLFLYDRNPEKTQRFTNGRWPSVGLRWSHSGRFLAFSSNARNEKDQDLYLIEPPIAATGRRLKDARGACQAQDWSPDDRRIAVVEWSPDSSAADVHLIDRETGKVETVPQPTAGPVIRSAVLWSKDGSSLFWITNRDSEFNHLARYDLSSGQEVVLTEGIARNVEGYDLSDDGSTIVLNVNEEGCSRLHVLDAKTGRERSALRLAEGWIANLCFRPKSLEFAFEWGCSQAPTGLYSYDVASGSRTEWVKPRRVSPKSGSGSDPIVISYPTFDGRRIPAFLSYPDPKFKGPRPVLIEIHGGPYFQYQPRFSGLCDYLTGELGIVLIHPNVRGSTGYDQSYEQLDNGRNREDAVRDVSALLDWIGTQPDLDSSRVVVSGGSYGGYMALATMLRYGDRIRAGIDVSGFSDFETLMKNADARSIAHWRIEYGDERDPRTLEFFRTISPLANADKIRKPLLVIHGENDPRVKVGEAEQIVSAVRKNGVPVWYVRFAGEGHNIAKREHVLYSQHARVLFLKHYLLGKE